MDWAAQEGETGSMTTTAKTFADLKVLATRICNEKGVACRVFNEAGSISVWVNRGLGLQPVIEGVSRTVAHAWLCAGLDWLPDAPDPDLEVKG